MRKKRKLSLAITSFVIILLGLLVLSSAACGGGSPEATPEPESQDSTPTPPPGAITPPPIVDIDGVPSQSVYLPGESVTVEFSFENMSTEPILIWPFSPEIEVALPRSNEVIRSFPAGSSRVELKSDETITFTLSWDQKDNSGQQVPSGYYRVSCYCYAASEDSYHEGWEARHGRDSGSTRILVQYAQGAMEKSIWANQSQTASELTITLELVELSAGGAEVYTLASLEFSPPFESPFPVLPAMSAPAQYSVDGGPVKDAGNATNYLHVNGIGLVWEHLDPIPSDANALVFTITKMRDFFTDDEWLGPWEFEVPLQEEYDDVDEPSEAWAVRDLPATVSPGSEFQVEIQATGYGFFGQLDETLPEGFTYVSSSLKSTRVRITGQQLTFTLLGELSFTYNVLAPDTPDIYTFDGTFTPFEGTFTYMDPQQHHVDGDTEVTVS